MALHYVDSGAHLRIEIGEYLALLASLAVLAAGSVMPSVMPSVRPMMVGSLQTPPPHWYCHPVMRWPGDPDGVAVGLRRMHDHASIYPTRRLAG